jgi:hypothetical protein
VTSPADIIAGSEFPTQDFIILGGEKSPGKATVTSGAFTRKYDVREPYGASGGSTVYQGDEIKRASVLIELWKPEQYADWTRFARKVIFAKVTKAALTVDHPVLEAIQFKECQVESLSAWDEDDEGLWSCTIGLLEFKRPKPALSKPLAAIPNAAKPTPTAQDAADLEIQKLTKQFSALAGS